MADNLPFRREMTFEYGVAAEVAPGVRRIVANNPSDLTYKGTNTYLIGSEEVAVIDPGPDLPEHIQSILAATSGEKISHILISHTHKDHTASVPALKQATGAAVMGFDPKDAPRGVAAVIDNGVEHQDQFVDFDFEADHYLCDGETVTGKDWTLEAIWTPGHAPDHMCYGLQGHRRVFTGDHIMGWNTTMVAPPEGTMAHYMKSLEKLLPRNDIEFFPGHGGRVTEPRRVVRTYLMHRQMREAAIMGCLKQGIGTVEGIVEKVYGTSKKDSIASYAAASSSVFAHVVFLYERGLVEPSGGVLAPDASYAPLPASSP